MNKNLKKQLMNAFEPPKAVNKEIFLRNLNYPKLTLCEFIHRQLGYVRKRVWCVSFLLFAIIIFVLYSNAELNNTFSTIGMISALVPYLALVMILELLRSSMHGMAELEMTTRYPLSTIIITRMGILGLGNILFFFLILPIISYYIEFSMLKLGIYLLVPYLLTCALSFGIMNHLKEKDITFYCGISSILVSISLGFIGILKDIMYEDRYFITWVILAVLLTFITIRQGRKIINRAEEIEWSLYLTE